MKAIATVIVPTFGNAGFARWAIKSVQQQTVKNIEICIICDGSPKHMIDYFTRMGKEDRRIKVFAFPKSPRTGEPYRDIVIKQTTGRIICYCSHDDLWLPHHISCMEMSLRRCWFTHSIHVSVNLPVDIHSDDTIIKHVGCADITYQHIVDWMFSGENNCFGLTFGAHTRKCYNELVEGWATTPLTHVPTDLHMWRKFLSQFQHHCATTVRVTALNFPHPPRKDWTEQERDDELKLYFQKIQDPAFLKTVNEQSLKLCPLLKQ